MTYENFLKIILKQQLLDRQIEEAYKLKIDLIDFVDGYHEIISTLIKEIYGEDGYEWYSWFCYESEYGHKGVEAWDKDKNPICFSFESTWEYLENSCKAKPEEPVVKEKELVSSLSLEDLMDLIMDDSKPLPYTYFKPKKETVKYDSTTEPFISLYDYQKRTDYDKVGKQLFKYAKYRDVKTQTRNIENPKYQGIVMLYPRNIIEDFFKELKADLPF